VWNVRLRGGLCLREISFSRCADCYEGKVYQNVGGALLDFGPIANGHPHRSEVAVFSFRRCGCLRLPPHSRMLSAV
jgi:hypothetical protein